MDLCLQDTLVQGSAVGTAFNILDHSWSLRKKIGGFGAEIYPLPSEGQRICMIVSSSSRAPQAPPSQQTNHHQNKSVTIVSIPGT